MNLPNKITLSRIFLVPIFMIFVTPVPTWMLSCGICGYFIPQIIFIDNFLNKYGVYIGAFIFLFAAATDGIDGYIARNWNMVTNLGKFLDPIADKLLVTAALLVLVQKQEVSVWVAVIILAREFIVTGFRLVAAGEGVVISASIWGKIKTLIQIIAISLMLFKIEFIILSWAIDDIFMWLAVLITVISGIDYVVKNIDVLAKNN